MGKRVAKTEKLEEIVGVRMTAAERSRLRGLALAAGESESSLLRKLALARLATIVPVEPLLAKEISVFAEV